MSSLRFPSDEPEEIRLPNGAVMPNVEAVPEGAETSTRGTVHRRKVMRNLLGGLGTLTFAGLILSQVGGSSAEAELARLRQAGVPTTPADMRRHPIAPETNAAPIYRAIIQRSQGTLGQSLSRLKEDGKEVFSGAASRAELAEVDAAIRTAEPLFTMARKASLRPGCDFDWKWELGANLNFPEYAHLKTLVNVLTVRAVRRGDQGNLHGAMDDLRTAAGVARHLGSNPSLIAGLAQIASEDLVTQGVWRVLTRSRDRVRAAQEARNVIDAFGPIYDLRKGMAGEVVGGRITMDQLRRDPLLFHRMIQGNDGAEPDGTVWIGRAMRIPFINDAWRAQVLHEYRLTYEALPQDPTDVPAVRRATRDSQRRVDAMTGWSTMLARVFEPVFISIGDSVGTQLARRRALLAACDRFEGLTSRQIDPFDGQPIRVKQTPDGFVAYSIGPDGRDDEGLPRDRSKGKSYDLAFPYPPLPPGPSTWRPHSVGSPSYGSGWVER